MNVKYWLVKNHLTGNGDYRARVRHAGVVSTDELVDHIERQGTTVTRPDILGVIEGYHRAVESFVLQGFKVHTPTVKYGLTIKGSFDQDNLDFDPSCHHLEATLTQGSRLRRTLRERGQVVRTDPTKALPTLLFYLDYGAQEQDGAVTPGALGRVVGHRLQFDPADPAQGVFFVAVDGRETRVEMVCDNLPSQLTFLVPTSLAPGSYRLEVRVAPTDGKVQTSSLDKTLTV